MARGADRWEAVNSLCEAFGLDPTMVASLRIDVDARSAGIFEVSATMFSVDDKGKVREWSERYKAVIVNREEEEIEMGGGLYMKVPARKLDGSL